MVSVAAKAAGVSRSNAYAHKEADEEFAKQWVDAIEEAADLLEREAISRAYSGTLRPIYHNGKKAGTERVYSDTLLIFLLKGARPGKYRENHRVEVSGPGGGAIPIREVIVERVAAPEVDE